MSRLSRRLQASEQARWGLAALVVCALFGALLLCSHITFDTNDDSTITAIAAGYLSGTPDAATVFTSFGYGAALSGLYGLLPAVPWHAVLLLLTTMLAQTALVMTCLTLCAKAGIRMRYGLAAFMALWLGVLMRYSVQLQFSTAAGLAFTAGLALACLPTQSTAVCTLRCRFVLSGIFLLLAFALRPNVALMLVPYALIPVLLGWLQKLPSRRTLLLFGVCLLLGYAALYLLDTALYRAQPGWDAFAAYDAELTTFLDYTANDLSAERYQAALTAAGWSPGLGQLVRGWYFADARIHTQSLAQLNHALMAQAPQQSLLTTVIAVFRATGSILLHYPMFRWIFAGFALAATVTAVLALRRRSPWNALRALLPLGYALMLIAFFYGILGRFPLRIAFAAACPAYMLVLVSMAETLPAQAAPAANGSSRTVAGVLAVLLLCGAIGTTTGGENGLTLRAKYPDGRRNAVLTDQIVAYVAEHPDTVFITDFCPDFSPLTVYPTGAMRNLIYWGSGVTHSPAAVRQLQALGLEALNANQFFSPHVRLLLVSGSSALETYLTEDYRLAALIQTDQTPDFTVYQAVR